MLDSLEHLSIKIFYGNVQPFSLARLVYMILKPIVPIMPI